jgi:hypothetical protein
MRNRRWLSCAAIVITTVTCAGQTAPTRVGATPATALLNDSEIHYIESGGIAGRVHEARFQAADGRVTVQYRAPDLQSPGDMQAGTVDNDAYLALWREAERLDLWTLGSGRQSRGADLVQSELRLRQGKRTHEARWDQEHASSSERLRAAATWARQVLAVAREYAANR